MRIVIVKVFSSNKVIESQNVTIERSKRFGLKNKNRLEVNNNIKHSDSLNNNYGTLENLSDSLNNNLYVTLYDRSDFIRVNLFKVKLFDIYNDIDKLQSNEIEKVVKYVTSKKIVYNGTTVELTEFKDGEISIYMDKLNKQ